jgi:hypothetical protein
MSVGSDSPLLRDWGKYRRSPRRGLPRWIWLLVAISVVAAVGVVVWLSRSSDRWRPPSGSPRFVSCSARSSSRPACRLRIGATCRSRTRGTTTWRYLSRRLCFWCSLVPSSSLFGGCDGVSVPLPLPPFGGCCPTQRRFLCDQTKGSTSGQALWLSGGSAHSCSYWFWLPATWSSARS